MSEDPSILIPVEEAIRLIVTAANQYEAVRIRNGVAYAAMKRRRPNADADACDEAYYDRWKSEVLKQRQGPMERLHWTGD